jgi:hypothetical protein
MSRKAANAQVGKAKIVITTTTTNEKNLSQTIQNGNQIHVL